MKIIITLLLLWITGYTACAQNLLGPGNALRFSSLSSSYVSCGTDQRGITQFVTAEAWINTTSSEYQWITGKYFDQSGDEHGFHLITIDGKASMNGRVGIGAYISSGSSTTRVNDGRWHHIVGVCNNNVWSIYVDGVLENSARYSYPTANLRCVMPLTIGNYFQQIGRFFDGEIDEVRVWNVARTETQIRESMCHKFATAPPELVAYYRFDATSGTTAADAGSQPTAGVLHNFSSAPWRLSGAALGDRSVFTYATSGSPANITTTTLAGDTLKGSSFSAQSRGAHLYVVDSPPVVPVPGGTSTAYFGLYTLSPSATYVAELHPGCRTIYQRSDNAVPTWQSTVPATRPHAVAAAGTYRAEYAWAGSSASVPVIVGNASICPGQPSTLTVVGAGTSFHWSTGATSQSITISQPGTYSVDVLYPGGCSSRAEFTVTAAPAPVPFSLGRDTTLCGSNTITLRAPQQPTGVQYRWGDGSNSPSLVVSQSGTYSLTTFNTCDVLTASIRIDFTSDSVTVPNIITPNADGYNDTFIVRQACSNSSWALEIYSRWGRRVYQTATYANDWAAPNLPAGTYYYYLHQAASSRTLKGWVEVVR